MKKIASFSESVDVLVKAYMNDTLEHENCYACAVGNLIASAKGYQYRKDPLFTDLIWDNDVDTAWYKAISCLAKGSDALMLSQISATGYSVEEITKIEYAFEGAPGRHSTKDEWMFNGLLAVVDVLADIHQVDLSTKESAVLQFSEIHALKV